MEIINISMSRTVFLILPILLSTLTCPLVGEVPTAKPKESESPAISLPAGLRLAAVVRPKRMAEVLAANGLTADVLGTLEVDIPNLLPKASLTEMVTVVMGMGEGAYADSRLGLVSLASPRSMDEFLKMIGELGTPELLGDDKYRERATDEGGVRHVLSCRQFSPQDYLFCRQRADRAMLQPGKALSALRTAVAQAGHLVWFGARGEALPDGVAGGKVRPGLTVTNIQATISCPGDLVIRAEGTLPTATEAMSFAAALRMMVPPMPIPDSVPAGIAPHQQFGTSGRTATYELVFPKASIGFSVGVFLKGFAHGFNRSSASRDAQNIASSYAAGCAAGSDALNRAASVEEIMALLEKGVTPEEGNFKTSRFQVQVRPLTDERRKEVAALLVLENGTLTLTPESKKATEEANRKAAAAPPGSVTAIAHAKRNAQNLASAHAAAMAAGSPELEKIDTLRGAIDALVKGVNGAGNFSSSNFKVSLTESEITRAMPYLTWEGGEFHGIRYTGATE